MVKMQKFNHLKLQMPLFWALRLLLLLLFHHHLAPSFCLNGEGLALLRFRERVVRDPFDALSNWTDHDGASDPCSWSGIECSDGSVVTLNLKDLCLGGTLGPELGSLPHMKAIILRNNSFFGSIPRELAELKELEVLDLGYNNFSGPFPFNHGDNLSLVILLLDNNELIVTMLPELVELQMISEYQVDENLLVSASTKSNCNTRSVPWINGQSGDFAQRRLLNVARAPETHKKVAHNGTNSTSNSAPLGDSHFGLGPAQSPSPTQSPTAHRPPLPASTPEHSRAPSPLPRAKSPVISSPQTPHHSAPVPSPASTPSQRPAKITSSKKHAVLVSSLVAGGSLLLITSVIVNIIFRKSKAVAVKPWATGISGKLQKAFVTGVPNLKRSELEVACEEFSNIIGSLSDGTVYKGTLSSGVEIAVVSTSVKSCQDWTTNLEAQFRKKIETLSKVNHKNFVNLIGHCEEDQPFTRMMVFEYSPNGTLFEHLHIQEAERLDWGTRVRIIMGIAYCLEHMHQLSPPIAHRDLQSSSVYLCDDYAAKVSDFSFWNSEETATKILRSPSMELLDTQLVDLETNVYNFGVILLEAVTGEIPYSEDGGFLAEWAVEYLRGGELPVEAIDPTLTTYQEDEVRGLFEIIKECLLPDPEERPTMRDITARLRQITEVEPSAAIPKISPLWWAELEILSTEGDL
ncbi:hypothetical protein Dimus_020522 [Dionaea muscipula]